jgi:hypothetical protein
MTIPITRKLLLIINTLSWTLHYTILSLPFYRLMPTYGVSQWSQYVFNLASIMAVFYATAYFMQEWLNNFSLMTFKELRPHKRVFYIFNKHIFKILLVTAAYIAVSLVLDNEFFGYNYTDIYLQFERRLARINAYAMAGPFYALVLFLLRMLNDRIRALETYGQNMYESAHRITLLYKTLKEETAKN